MLRRTSNQAKHPRLILSAIIVSLAGSISCLTDAANLYRYRDAEGVPVIDYSIPPEYVAQGYEILSPSGRVIEIVPPQQNAADPDADQPQANPEELARQQEARIKEDTWLLTSYSSVEEIEQAGQRRQEQLKREIDIVRTNKTETLQQLAGEKGRAANYQRSGRALPKNLTTSLANLYQQIRDADRLLLQRQTELEDLQKSIEKQVQRFKDLKKP